MRRDRAYRCEVCGWQGRAEPLDAGDASPCPSCGVFMYPQSWASTWGVVILIIALTVGLIVAASML